MRISRYIKTIGTIAGLTLIATFLANLTGCDLFGVTIEKRIEYFLDDLNNDRSNAITNFHPTETADYGAISTNATYWNTDFPPDGPYTLAALDDTNPRSVRATVNGPVSFGGGTDELEFIMIADGSNWLIEELWFWGGDFIVR
jgi:hypothetical protein